VRWRSLRGRRRITAPFAALLAAASLAAGCGVLSSSGPPAKGGSLARYVNLKGQSYTVGGKRFDEQLVLCQIAVAALESVNATVTDRCNIGGSDTTRKALLGGDIDLYWEYTGTAWVSYLNQNPIHDSTAQYEAVKQRDLTQNNIVWLQPTLFNNTYGFAVAGERAQQLKLWRLSDMAAYIRSGQPGNICIATEYQNRDDGLPGLQRTYNFHIPLDRLRVLQTGAIYQATADRKECLFGEIFTTDGRIPQLRLTVLQDDLHYHPLYNAAPTIRKQTYDRNPDIAKVFAPISAALTNEVITELNRQDPLRVSRNARSRAPGSPSTASSPENPNHPNKLVMAGEAGWWTPSCGLLARDRRKSIRQWRLPDTRGEEFDGWHGRFRAQHSPTARRGRPATLNPRALDAAATDTMAVRRAARPAAPCESAPRSGRLPGRCRTDPPPRPATSPLTTGPPTDAGYPDACGADGRRISGAGQPHRHG
jgi:osmoprotectant transport system substrate-binding protein